jgi:hypothetical protein
MSNRNEPAAFPFLKLPIELRLEVYSFIAPTTEYHGLYTPCTTKNPNAKYTVLERPALPIALLSTCRQIRSEATPYINMQMALMQQTPMRFTVDITSAQWLCCTNFLGRECFGLTPGGLYVRPSRPAQARPSTRLPIHETNAAFTGLLPLDINEAYTDHRGLIDVAAEMLVYVKTAARSSAQPYDVEIVINGNVKSLKVYQLTAIVSGLERMAEEADLAVKVTAKVDAGVVNGVTGLWMREVGVRKEERRGKVDYFAVVEDGGEEE